MRCSDCGGPPREINASTIRKGSSVREPGEVLCAGCSSTRARLVSEMEKIPATLLQIQALRMPRGV